MPEQINDIKKIDQDKIKEGREILLKYLAEVDQQTADQAKPSEKKSLDSLAPKPIEAKRPPLPPAAARPVEAKIDFVKDFKTAESKLNKPITEIIHQVMDKPAPIETIEPARPTPVAEPINRPQQEVKIDQPATAERPPSEKPPTAKPRTENFFFPKKKSEPEVKKSNKKKLRKIARARDEAETKKATVALDFLGKIIFKFLSAVTVLAIIYFIFCLTLYTFGFDNGVTRLITKIFPVPAFITQYGAVNYYDYMDAKAAAINEQKESDRGLAQVLASISAREKLIRLQILTGLAKNYGLQTGSLNSPQAELALNDKLALLIVSDPSINKDNLRKLRAIKSTLLGGADFVLAANSFGLQAKTEYFSADSIKEKFGSRALALAASSTIETTSVKQGYYVFQFYNQQDGLTGFKFIFVPAMTLEMIMTEKFKATNLIILAN